VCIGFNSFLKLIQTEDPINFRLECPEPIIIPFTVQMGKEPGEDIQATAFAGKYTGKICPPDPSPIRQPLENTLVGSTTRFKGQVGEDGPAGR
jgi:hypothetical protein